MTVQETLDYYASQLIIQYNGLPRASDTIRNQANCSVCDGLIFQLQTAFNISTAVGQQLAIIGRIVGVPYKIYGLDLSSVFFTFTNWNGRPPSVGFNRWTTPNAPGKFAQWQSSAIYIPTDLEMRTLIQLKIIKNNYYPSLAFVVPALYELFGDAIAVVDNFDSTITYNFQSPYHNVAAVCEFLGNILPKPMGKGISINQI